MKSNPIVEGYYADPEVRLIDGKFWVLCTFSYDENNPLPQEQWFDYVQQNHFAAFYSNDLKEWNKLDSILSVNDISWAEKAFWAPTHFKYKDKYYIIFSANDIQNNSEMGGIGIAVAEKMEGPYVDMLGKPLIGEFINKAQPIDAHVFQEDGKVYLYYGGWGRCNFAQLNEGLTGFETLENGEVFIDVTPENYVEGPCMIKRNGTYYFMWSEGDWTTSGYQVSYAKSDSLTGPFVRRGVILQGDTKLATGTGHHGVVEIGGKDEWMIFYHRRSIDETNPLKRQLCMEKLEFDQNGDILPVEFH